MKLPKVKPRKTYKEPEDFKYVVVTNPWPKPIPDSRSSESAKQRFANNIGRWFERMLVEVDIEVNVDPILGAHHMQDFITNRTWTDSEISEIYYYDYVHQGSPNTILRWDSVYPNYQQSDLANFYVKEEYPPPRKPKAGPATHFAISLPVHIEESIVGEWECLHYLSDSESCQVVHNESCGDEMQAGITNVHSYLSHVERRAAYEGSLARSRPPPSAPAPTGTSAPNVSDSLTAQPVSAPAHAEPSPNDAFIPYQPPAALAAMRANRDQLKREPRDVDVKPSRVSEDSRSQTRHANDRDLLPSLSVGPRETDRYPQEPMPKLGKPDPYEEGQLSFIHSLLF
ncbi:hypothetical protein BT96DRAFT_519023 [Gymnopus androsaceus JB14]|uniref:Uncharacterized protein n=1 Tax=Gymnopus androsaceus JB14 TaxID=1447944 RepID=A0A6A4GM61_9AGAR|nr:hypothetical protein BT96DRAFT_519023 [Gymnopus androsaceus JB14]